MYGLRSNLGVYTWHHNGRYGRASVDLRLMIVVRQSLRMTYSYKISTVIGGKSAINQQP